MLQLRWHGPTWGQSGYEVVTRGLLMALDAMGVMIRLHPANGWNSEKASIPFNVINRIQRMCRTEVRDTAPIVMHQQYWPDSEQWKASKFCYSLFETDKIPEPWREGFMKCQGIITFTEWNRQTWIADGIPEQNIHNVGAGIDWEAFGPNKAKPADIVNKRGYTFLANGDFTERKNFGALIEAYCKEFKPSEEVTLLIKSHAGGFIKPHKEYLYETIRQMAKKWSTRPPRILICADKLSEDEMPRLYAAAHCFVLPTRGEGLCLPVMEAMASGLPVITTGWSGPTDFIDKHEEGGIVVDKGGILLPYTLDIIKDVEYIKKCPHACAHKWANVNINALRVAMRWAFENRDQATQMGANASERMRHRTWHHAALKMLKAIYRPMAMVAKQQEQVKKFTTPEPVAGGAQ